MIICVSSGYLTLKRHKPDYIFCRKSDEHLIRMDKDVYLIFGMVAPKLLCFLAVRFKRRFFL